MPSHNSRFVGDFFIQAFDTIRLLFVCFFLLFFQFYFNSILTIKYEQTELLISLILGGMWKIKCDAKWIIIIVCCVSEIPMRSYHVDEHLTNATAGNPESRKEKSGQPLRSE